MMLHRLTLVACYLHLFVATLISAQGPPPVNCTNHRQPYKVKCRHRGTARVPRYTSNPQHLPNYDTCRDLCIRRPACVTLKWNEAGNLCHLTDARIGPETRGCYGLSVVANASSPSIFSSARCFTCQLNCPASGQNIYDNGGFELSNTFIGPWDPSRSVYHTVGRRQNTKASQSSNTSLPRFEVVSPGYQSANALLGRNTFRLVQGGYACTTFTFHLHLNYKVIASGNAFSLLEISIGANQILIPFSGSTKAWMSYDTYLVPQPFNGADLLYDLPIELRFFTHNHNTTVLVDNISAASTADNATVLPNAANKLQNGGFETGKLQPWKLIKTNPKYCNVSVVSPGLNSSYAIHWHYPKDFVNGAPRFNLTQTVTLVQGKLYVLDFDYKALAGSFYVVIAYTDGGSGMDNPYGVSTYTSSDNLKATNATQTSRTLFTAPANTTVINLWFNADFIGSVQDLFLDNFSVKEAQV